MGEETPDRNLGVSDDLLGTSTELLQAVVDSALAAVVVMDDEGLVAGWGKRATETFGFTRTEAIGKPLVELIVPPQYRDAHNAGLERYRKTGEGPVLGKVMELSALRSDGREFPAELAISPAAVVGGRTTFIAFIRDITERKEAERRQVDLYAYAADAVKALRDFASLAVHELRTPLSVAGGYTEMLLDGSFGPPSAEWTSSIQVVSDKLQEAMKLVDDLLVTSRIEGGALKPHLSTVDLQVVAGASVDRAKKRARVTGASVSLRTSGGPVRAAADSAMCAKIIDNLLNNAINHGGQGVSIEVVTSASPVPSVTVSNTGPGIAPDLQDKIFERFFRGSRPALDSGSGLGLYLSRELAEIQGAKLELVASTEAAGTTFRLSFPPAATSPA